MLKNKKTFTSGYSPESIQRYAKKLEEIQVESFLCDKENFNISAESGEMVAEVFGEKYPVRETALNSILCRYGVGGDTFRKLDDTTLSSVLGMLKNYLPETFTVMIADGALNSVNSESYVHIPMKEVFDKTCEMVRPFYDTNSEPASVDSDYAVSTVYFKTDKNYEFNGSERKLFVRLTNSENGDASIQYQAYLGRNDAKLPIMSEIKIVHKGKADSEKVNTALSELEAVITKNVEAIRMLERVDVTMPTTAVKELMAEAGLPKKSAKALAEKIKLNPTVKYTAADLYEMIYDQIVELGKEERYTNDVLKLTRANWSKYSNTANV